MKIFNKSFWHKHRYTTPIVSMYKSFNTRNIIWECSCGGRKSIEEYSPNRRFAIPTDSITYKEFKAIVDGAEYYKIGTIVLLKY